MLPAVLCAEQTRGEAPVKDILQEEVCARFSISSGGDSSIDTAQRLTSLGIRWILCHIGALNATFPSDVGFAGRRASPFSREATKNIHITNETWCVLPRPE